MMPRAGALRGAGGPKGLKVGLRAVCGATGPVAASIGRRQRCVNGAKHKVLEGVGVLCPYCRDHAGARSCRRGDGPRERRDVWR